MKAHAGASTLTLCLLGTSVPRGCAFLQHEIGALHQHHPSPLSSSRSRLDLDQFDGLSEDGDFLIVGINGGDPLETDTDESNYSASSPQSSPSFGLRVASADDSIDLAAVQRFREARPSTGINAVDSDDDEEALESVGEWLSDIMPTLRDSDIDSYARKFVAIGFAPDCVTQCELTWDDLSFMKLLHRRYLFNEITGQDHPWEA